MIFSINSGENMTSHSMKRNGLTNNMKRNKRSYVYAVIHAIRTKECLHYTPRAVKYCHNFFF